MIVLYRETVDITAKLKTSPNISSKNE